MTSTFPASTYRYQINSAFTLFDAAEDLPRVARLGVDAVYLSPVLTATRGSDHGYDWVDCRSVDPQRGGEEGWAVFTAAARAAGLKVVLDIVPNHCGIAQPDQNPFWWSVLREGRDSPYAHWFDVDWTTAPIVLPLLPADGSLAGLELSDDLAELWVSGRRLPVAPGTAAPGDDVTEVAARQHYRLVPGRAAAEELNYRRFFLVDSLAAVRVEDEEVFDAVHERVLRMVAAGEVHGLRIDHPDGLADPGGYFNRLRDRVGPDVWLLGEKILADGEALPDWPIEGTTGYDAMAELTRLFTWPAAEPVLTRGYVALTGDRRTVEEHVLAGKAQVLPGFGSEVNRILRSMPVPVRDHERAREALEQVALRMPVYRTYLPEERDALDEAVRRTTADRPDLAEAVAVLLPVIGDGAQEAAVRFQQLTGALMAKGLEDTAWYRWSRWIGANEVGGDPARFATTIEEFHADQQHRQATLPHSMTALSTHDTKRGEDVRAALAALTEMPDDLLDWSRALVSLADVPDPSFGHLLAQTLAAIGPVPRARLHEYATKAMREASVGTSWAAPDQAFEDRIHHTIDLAYDDGMLSAQWLALRARLAGPALSNVLAQKLVQLTMPGIPDVYRGTEVIEDGLVDPDNRRLPDLELLAASALDALPRDATPDQAKQWVVRQALHQRRDHRDAFTDYEPVLLEGPMREHLVGFNRGGAITLATRLPLGLARAGGWGESSLHLAGAWTNVLTGETFSGEVPVSVLLQRLPVALLMGA